MHAYPIRKLLCSAFPDLKIWGGLSSGSNLQISFWDFFQPLMAAYANYLRLARLGTSSGLNLSTFRSIGSPNPIFDRSLFDHHEIRSSSSSLVSYSPYRQSHARFISQLVKTNGKRVHLVDTLALVIIIITFLLVSYDFVESFKMSDYCFHWQDCEKKD